MKRTVFLLLGALLTLAPGLGQAGWYGHGYHGHARHGGFYGYRGPVYGGYRRGYYRGYRRGRHDDSDKYGYLVGGLALGALAHSVLSRPRNPQVVYVERPYSSSTSRAPAPQVRTEQVPTSQLDSWYFRDRDGNCSFIERDANGDEIATPVAPQECEF